jgi:hypothetical protein
MVWDKVNIILQNIHHPIASDDLAKIRTHTLAMVTDVAASYWLEESLQQQGDAAMARQWSEIQDLYPI